MIDPNKLTPLDIGKRVIYRAQGAGSAEYAELLGCHGTLLYIRVQGDAGKTEALPNELTWVPQQ
jgi:hypothetical protein